jgi:transposase
VKRVLSGMSVIAASAMAGFSERTGHKWLSRFRSEGHQGLEDRSSQPHRLARSHELGLVVEAVGRRRRGQAAVRIARKRGVPRSTVGFWLRKAGTALAASLIQKEPDNRYEHEAPGDLLHLDTKKLANFNQDGHLIHRTITPEQFADMEWAVANHRETLRLLSTWEQVTVDELLGQPKKRKH